MPPEHAIRGPREPRGDRLHPSSQCGLTRGFDDEVSVIALDREMHDAELAALARFAQAAAELADEALRAQGGHVGEWLHKVA